MGPPVTSKRGLAMTGYTELGPMLFNQVSRCSLLVCFVLFGESLSRIVGFGVGVLMKVFPQGVVDAVIAECGRTEKWCSCPHWFRTA